MAVEAGVAGEPAGEVVGRAVCAVELDEAVVEARLLGLVELVGENGVCDQLLWPPAAGKRPEWVGDLMAPGIGAALVAAFSWSERV